MGQDTFCRHCRKHKDTQCAITVTGLDAVSSSFGPYCDGCMGAVFTNYVTELPIHKGYVFTVTKAF